MFYQNTYIPGPYKPDYYTSVDEANADIVMQSRYPGMSVYIIDTSNILTEYWYKDDISDGGLIPKVLSAPGTVTVEEDPVWEAEKVNYYEKTQVDTLLTAKADLVDGIVPSNQLPDMIIPHHVTNYSALPDPTTVANQTYFVLNSQGTKWLPGSLGGTYYPVGIYYSDGTQWIYMGEFAYQATQSDTNAEANNTNFVTPFTLGGWATQKTFSSGDLAGTVTTPTIKGGVVINDVSASAAADFANRQLKIGALISIDWSSALKLPQLANSSSTSFLQTSADGTVSAVPVPVTSVFGRTGNVAATDGDYDTSLVTENGNLYFLNSRAIGATLTAYAAGAGIVSSTDSIISAIQKLDGNIGGLVTGVSSFNTRAGAVTLSSGDVTGALGFTPMNGSATLQTISDNGNATTTAISAQNYIVTGTTGSGYIFLPTQTVAPTTPVGGDNLYHLSTGLTWMGASGFSKTFSGSGLTASRVYTLPDANGTLALAATTLAGYGITDAYPLIGNPSGFITSGALPISANPSASVGLTTVNGTATTFMTSDSAPALDQTIAPTWTNLHTFGAGLISTGGTIVAQRSGVPAQNILIDPTNNYITQYSNPAAAKVLSINATTDTSNTTPSNGTPAITLKVLGVTNLYTDSSVSYFSNSTGRIMTLFGGTGNVVIKTSSSVTDGGYKLDVQGTIRSTGLLSANGGISTGLSTMSAAAWGTTSPLLNSIGATITDTSTAASGTVSTTTAFNSFAAPTLAATNTGVTYSGILANVYIQGGVAAGTNVTATGTLYALYAASGNVGIVNNLSVGSSLSTVSRFSVGSGLTIPQWGTNGPGFAFQNATFTDSSTAASGTVSATTGIYTIATPVIAATNTNVTYSGTVASLYLTGAPIAGTNVTFTGSQYALYITGSGAYVTHGLTVGAGGNTSAWGINGPGLQVIGSNYTDTSTAASATVSSAMMNTFGTPTIIATNTGVTYTTASTVYINAAPAAGTNVTITNPYALIVNTGNTYLGGGLLVGSANTAPSSGNLIVAGVSTGVRYNPTNLSFASPASGFVGFRNAYTATTAQYTLTANDNYAQNIFGYSSVTTAATGTHAMLANVAINPLNSVTSGGATVTNTATLYVGGASTAGTNNYGVYVASGGIANNGGFSTGGAISKAAWGSTAIQSNFQSATYTDSSTAASGTVAGTTVFNSFGIPTLAATNTGVTYSGSLATVYIAGAPVAGTNVTLTNTWALYVAGGNSFFNSQITTNGGIQASVAGTGSNFYGVGGVGTVTVATTGLLFGGASSVVSRINFNGSTTATLATGTSYSNVIVGSSPITTFTSGTHAVLANMVVNPLGAVTSGGATVTTTATLYVNGAGSGGSSNYSIFSPSGNNYLGGSTTIGLGLTVGGATVLSGNMTLAAWGTTGVKFNVGASTFTDNSTAASGTVSGTTAFNTIQTPTLAATNTSVTYSGDIATWYVTGAPTVGTNITSTGNLYASYINSGDAYFGGYVNAIGGIHTGSKLTSNLFVEGGTGAILSQSTTGLTFGGSLSVSFRTVFNGSTSTTLASGNSYSNVIVGSSPITTFTSGTHSVLANMVVNPIGTVTSGGATVTTTASLYVNGANASGVSTSNFAIYATGASLLSSLGVGTASQSRLTVGNSISGSAWGTAGLQSNFQSATYTDNTTAASGTVSATTAFNSFGTPTLNSTNTSVTYSGNVATVYIAGAPIVTGNVTSTGTLWSLYVNAGSTQLGGNTLIGNGTIQGNARLSISAASSGANTATTGVHLAVSANAYIDTSTALNGTASWAVQSSFGIPTFNSTNTGVTYTNAATLLIQGAPIAGASATITNPYALYIAGGNSYFGGNIQTSTTFANSNFGTGNGGSLAASTNTTGLLFGGASTVGVRSFFNGNISSTLTTGVSYSNVIVGSSPITTFTSGTHSILANLVVNPIGTVTSGGAAVTTTASLYVNGAGSGGSINYAMYVLNGNNFLGGRTAIGTSLSGSSWLTIGGSGNIAPWGTTGSILNAAGSTIGDNSTAASGTVSATTAFNSFGIPTLAATNTNVTYSGNVATVYIAGAPTAGTNVTAITNPYSLYINSGNSYLGGGLTIPVAQKVKIATGTNAIIGQATLVAGTVTVSTTSVTASSLIFLTINTIGGTPGFNSSTIVAGTSFTINSTSSTDTSIINWWIVN